MKHIIATLVAAAIAGPAMAGNAYIGGSVGRTEHKMTVEGTSVTDDDTATKLFGGYQITPAVGVEAGYAFLGESKVSGNGATLGAEPKSMYLAVTGTLPLSPVVSAFVKLGAARTKTTFNSSYLGVAESYKNTDTSVIAGIGASYAISKQVALIAEYEHFGKIAKDDGASLKADLLSVGVRFNF
ncbi:MAG TPA: outer membrane beta-barrel protein [Telluria sp.]